MEVSCKVQSRSETQLVKFCHCNRASLHISPIAAFEIRGQEARASLSAGRRKSAVACDKQLRPTPTPKSRTFYCLIGNRRRGERLSLQLGFVPHGLITKDVQPLAL